MRSDLLSEVSEVSHCARWAAQLDIRYEGPYLGRLLPPVDELLPDKSSFIPTHTGSVFKTATPKSNSVHIGSEECAAVDKMGSC